MNKWFLLALLFVTVSSIPRAQIAQQWERRFNGPSNQHDRYTAVLLDPQGNVIVVGESLSATGWNLIVLKYSPSGSLLWSAGRQGVPHAVVIDSQGNVIVTGQVQVSPSYTDFLTVKYGSGGQLIWERAYNGPSSQSDVAYAIAVDSEDNVYVTGSSHGGSLTRFDYATIKYSADVGQVLWLERYNGIASLGDEPAAIAVDPERGAVYVTGRSQGTWWDFATLCYNAGTGQQQWTQRYNGPGNFNDEPSALKLDSQGNVIIVGSSLGIGTGRDFIALKYSPIGSLLWTARHNGPSNDADDPTALAIDPQDNLIVTGFYSGDLDDHLTIKLNAQGQLLWERTYSSGLFYNERPGAVACDSEGNIYVAGSAWNTEDNEDFYTYKYTPDGWIVWDIRYNAPGDSGDAAYGIALQGNSLYVAGNSSVNAALTDIVVVKYSQNGPRTGDVNGDGCVNDNDLLAVLFAFGQTGLGLPEDLNFDLTVDDADLLLVLLNFGEGC